MAFEKCTWSAERENQFCREGSTEGEAGASLQGGCGSCAEGHIWLECTARWASGELGLMAQYKQSFGELPIVYVITAMLSQLIINTEVLHLVQKCQSFHSDKMPLHPYDLKDVSM